MDEEVHSTASVTLNITTAVEALSIARTEDDSTVTARAGEVDADRSQRMGADVDVIKDGISALRYLDRFITLSTHRLQETGRMDGRTAHEAAGARTAWHDTVADTIVAALPIVQAGYSIAPDDEA